MKGESGQVGLTLLAWLLVLLMVLALVLDLGRSVVLRLRVSDAVDAAALAAASTAVTVREVDAYGTVYSVVLSIDPDRARQAALDCLALNFARLPGAEAVSADVTVDDVRKTVLVSVRARVGTQILGGMNPDWRWFDLCVASTAEALLR